MVNAFPPSSSLHCDTFEGVKEYNTTEKNPKKSAVDPYLQDRKIPTKEKKEYKERKNDDGKTCYLYYFLLLCSLIRLSFLSFPPFPPDMFVLINIQAGKRKNYHQPVERRETQEEGTSDSFFKL